ncbi:MAG TPA: arsenite methyltransferase [Candidatus Limnocylindria bacterium]
MSIEETVRAHYAEKALRMADGGSCCDSSCCDGATCGNGYAHEELASLGLDESVSLGCANPTALADLAPGEVVLDLGSGAGLDVLLSARRVGETGHAYGVDMTDEMLARANENRARAGVRNATFLRGTIDRVPLDDASVDVVISNCVINLAADKDAVLREAFRVLRPGGRFAVADMVALEELPDAVKRRLDAWAGCIAGTIPADRYVRGLRAAGFVEPDVEIVREVALDGVDGRIASALIRASKPLQVPDRGPALAVRPNGARGTARG